MEYYLNGIEQDIWCPIKQGPFYGTTFEAVGTNSQNRNMTVTWLKKAANDKSCIWIDKSFAASRLQLY